MPFCVCFDVLKARETLEAGLRDSLNSPESLLTGSVVLLSRLFGALSAFSQVQPHSSTSSLEPSQLPAVTAMQSAIIYQMVGTVLKNKPFTYTF